MARHKGETEEVKEVKETPKNAEDALYELPSNIKNFSTSKKTEESISNQMLSGIPEIDLGIESAFQYFLFCINLFLCFINLNKNV